MCACEGVWLLLACVKDDVNVKNQTGDPVGLLNGKKLVDDSTKTLFCASGVQVSLLYPALVLPLSPVDRAGGH